MRVIYWSQGRCDVRRTNRVQGIPCGPSPILRPLSSCLCLPLRSRKTVSSAGPRFRAAMPRWARLLLVRFTSCRSLATPICQPCSASASGSDRSQRGLDRPSFQRAGGCWMLAWRTRVCSPRARTSAIVNF